MKSIKKFLSLVLLLVVIVFIGYYLFQSGKVGDFLKLFDNKNTQVVKLQEAGYSQKTVDTLVDGNNKLAFDLYQQYLSDEALANKNVFYSPISVHSALAMTYEGAKGDTADQIREVLYLPEDRETRLPSYARTFNQINAGSDDYTLLIANAIWIQQDFSITDEYKEIITDYYGGEATNLDFINDTDNSRETINSWVENKTNDKIKNLFPVEAINTDTRFVLTNAVYFKGNWKTQFDVENTSKQEFTVLNGDKIDVDMMQLTGESFGYMENDDIQMLELDYDGDELSMIIILPKECKFEDVEQKLSLENYENWKGNISPEDVNVYLPKFKFETEATLNQYLEALGIINAFYPSDADFSGISGNYDFFINSIRHKAFIEVNEEGTEATAATGVSFDTVSVIDVKTFRADRPFMFFIQHKGTGSILFMGRVSEQVNE